ncbi:hypothetical protein EJ065_1526 [Corallococcus coralloides]|uniref:Uncharacterized protein n=1 Tax=Corallococcus coralloides TaxID=184914 RepID=A0A410RMR6_CORCK|nr:hypothetical protein EJ065_1526 [Corallococcus coralloides]
MASGCLPERALRSTPLRKYRRACSAFCETRKQWGHRLRPLIARLEGFTAAEDA